MRADAHQDILTKLAKTIWHSPGRRENGPHAKGALFTSLATGDVSSKLVEAYKLHPNSIKSLATCGQGYLFNDEGLRPVAYGMLPQLASDFPLQTKDQANARGLRLYERFIARRPLRVRAVP